MTGIIGPVRTEGAEVAPLPALEQVRQYIRASKAESTLRGYQSDWRLFCEWCEGNAVLTCPPKSLPLIIRVLQFLTRPAF